MRFYCVKYWQSLPIGAQFPCVLLRSDSWNDLGYHTTFHLSYHTDHHSELFSGDVKILQKGKETTILPVPLERLDNKYCSLGQNLEYYQGLEQLGEDVWRDILISLNDAVLNPEIVPLFAEEKGWRHSLLRFIDAEKALMEGGSILHSVDKGIGHRRFQFDFSCLVPGAAERHYITFDFRRTQTRLFRMMAIIGRNGTGKTQVLASFANAMSGLEPDDGTFFPQRPSFSRVIAISYSVFDQFKRPQEYQMQYSYKYFGIRPESRPLTEGESHLLTQAEMLNNLTSAWSLIENMRRVDKWIKIISILLPDMVSEALSIEEITATYIAALYLRLSSGQRILLLVMTQVISFIATESLVLFDEPELHLHPDAISALAQAFRQLLEEFSSYAIIATHSPIILQEIPAKYVRVFRREGNYPIVEPLTIESFGENLTTITDDVFETSEDRHNYRDYLKTLLNTMSFDEIVAAFDGRLGFNALTSLRAAKATQGRE